MSEDEKKRGGVKALLLGDTSARDAAANNKLNRKFRKRQMQREDNEGEREFKKRRRAQRRTAFAAGVINIARAMVVVIPITAPMAVAWTGQIGFATGVLDWPFIGGALYAAAYELTTVFCGWLYHEARKDGDGGFVYRLAMWVFAMGAAGQQWWHYLNPDGSASYRSVTFATMTLVGVVVFELFARLVHRRTLRRAGKVDDSRPRFGLMRWARYPHRTFDAWSLTIQHPTRFNTVDLAWSEADRLTVQRQRQRSARRIARSARSILSATQDPGAVRARSGWFNRGSAAPSLSATQDPRTVRASILSGPQDPAGPVLSAAQGRGAPQIDEAPTARTELESGRTSGPDLIKYPADPSPTDVNESDDFEPTSLERQAVVLLVETVRSINRANCAIAVRELNGAISTARASQLAAWGRAVEMADRT